MSLNAGFTRNPNRITPAMWLADFGDRITSHLAPIKLDPDAFVGIFGTYVIVGTNTAADATSIPVAALTNAIPAGTLLSFGGKKFARTNTLAAKGATAVAVDAIPTALVAGDTASYKGKGKIAVPSGTYVGRTDSEVTAKAPYGPVAVNDTDRLLITYLVPDVVNDSGATAVRRKVATIKQNFLPDWARISADATLLGYLRTDYQCINGAA